MFGAKKAILRVCDALRGKSDSYVEVARGFPVGAQERTHAFIKAAVLKDVADILAKEAEGSTDVIDVGTAG